LNDASQYNLFQVMFLLEQNGFKDRFRIIPAVELAFPASDMKRAYLDAKGNIIIETTYLGLYGVNAPLPFYFLEVASRADEKGEVFRSFLNIFNNRIYQLLFETWKRGKSVLYLSNEESRYKYYLEALAQQLLPKHNLRAYAYVGLFGSRVHNAEGLKGILQNYLKFPVAIEQFVPVWVSIKESSNIIPYCLGDNTILGDKILDHCQKIRIYIGPVKFDKISWIFGDKKESYNLVNLIQKYVGLLIQFDIVLKIHFDDREIRGLGKHSLQLNFSTWLGYLENIPIVLRI